MSAMPAALPVEYHRRGVNAFDESLEIISSEPLPRNQVRETQGADEPNAKADVARACSKIVVTTG